MAVDWAGLMTAIRRVCLFACLCWSITDLAQAVQVTITWDCNTEADVMAYGIEMGRGNGWGLVAVIPHRMNGGAAACASPRSFQDIRYIAPGTVQYRIFAIDRTNNFSIPTVRSVTIPDQGGGSEHPLQPSLYDGSSISPPPPGPPPPPPPPPPPDTTPPGQVTSVTVTQLN